MSEKDFQVTELRPEYLDSQPAFWFAINWSRGPADSRAPFVQIQLSRSAYEGLMMTFLVTLHLGCFGLVHGLAYGQWIEYVRQGTLTAQMSLVALWLAASPWPLWKRLPVITLVTAFGLSYIDSFQHWLEMCCYIVAMSLIWGLARVLFGWRICLQLETMADFPAWRSGGSLRGVLGYMLVVSILLTAFIQLRIPTGSLMDAFSFIGVLMLLQSVLGIAALCHRCRACLAIAVGVVVAYLLMLAIAYKFYQWPQSINFSVAAALCSTPLFSGTLYLMSRLGWRLCQREVPARQAGAVASVGFDMLH
jgi:hypothetical protein